MEVILMDYTPWFFSPEGYTFAFHCFPVTHPMPQFPAGQLPMGSSGQRIALVPQKLGPKFTHRCPLELKFSGWWCNNYLEKYESQWEG